MNIEFLGMSRAGKTTQIRRLTEILECRKLDVSLWTRPKVKFKDFKSPADFHQFIIEDMIKKYESNGSDILIYDRGFYDRYALLEFDYKNKEISLDVKEDLQSYVLNMNKNDHSFLFLVGPNLSLIRWKSQKKEGLDSSNLNKGMKTGDHLRGLKNLFSIYTKIMPNIMKNYDFIFGESPLDKNSEKIINALNQYIS
ncbi:MAG: hypothetical protein ACTSUC_06360 [Promethearchaeota archaeon]